MPMGAPGATGVVGIARVGGLCVHAKAVLPRRGGLGATQRLLGLTAGRCSGNLQRGLAGPEAIDWLAQEIDRGGELSVVSLESDPGGTQ